MPNRFSRRTALARAFQIPLTAGVAGLCIAPRNSFGEVPNSNRLSREQSRERVVGMLLGSLIGDAAGGPVEFQAPSAVQHVLPAVREWADDKRLDQGSIHTLSKSFRLLSYAQLRSKPEPYAHWTKSAGPGTVTDDTRHKIILMNALRGARHRKTLPIGAADLAEQYVGFSCSEIVRRREGYTKLCDEWLVEYNKAARWVLGQREASRALPPERLWGGIPTNAGQMALLPLAAVYPGDPTAAYKAAFSLGFIDNGNGKDINSAIVAGLSRALTVTVDPAAPHAAWAQVRQAMKQTDPYQYGKVPWVNRSVGRWLDFADAAAQQAERSPKRLFQIIEQDIPNQTWWEAHVPFVSAFSILKFCDFDPLAAMHLTLDLGHDTDSTAQLLGAFVGAVHGPDVFPESMRRQVFKRFEADYAQSISEWADLLLELSDRNRYSEVIKFL